MRLPASPRALLALWSWLPLVLALTLTAAPASAQQSAAPAAADPLARLLDVLRDDQQRATLIDSLEQAQGTAQGTAPAATEGAQQAPAEAPPPAAVVQGGVLGALSATLDSLQQNLGDETDMVSDWQYHLNRAARELADLGQRVDQSATQVSARFVLTIAVWGFFMLVACWSGARLAARIARWPQFAIHRRTRDIVAHWLRVPLPAIAAFLLTLAATAGLGADSPGRMLALGIAYAVNTGTVFATLWLSLAILARGSHRKRAVEILRRRAFISVAALATFGSFAEALLNASPLTALLGYSLAYLLATICGAISTLILALFALRFRRPVGHLIYNRNLAHRRRLPASVRESLKLFSKLWFLPVLMMCLVSLYQLLLGSLDNHQAMNQMVASTLVLIGTLLSMALLHQLVAPAELAPQAQLGTRMRRLTVSTLQLLLLATAVELMSRIWGGSIYALVRDTEAGQMFGGAVFSTAAVLLVTLVAWILLDAAIAHALAPPTGRRHSQPSLRVRTILPLLRNAAKIILCVIAVITVLGNIGINIAPLLAGAGVVGLAIGFGSQTLVQDVITGIFNILEDTMAIGDWVEIDGRAGTVEGMTIRTLKLRDSAGALFSIPFSQVKAVRNTSRQFAFAPIDLRFTLDTDIDRALELVRQAADQTQRDPALQTALLGQYEDWGLERVNAEGYVVAGRFRATTGGAANVRRAFYLYLARLVAATAEVSFTRTYVGER